jgi:hypothetical protein
LDRVFALVEYGGEETNYMSNIAVDEMEKITIKFHRRRLTEDQNLEVRVGDFVRYGSNYFEIVKKSEPKHLFGQPEHEFETIAECIRAREGLFNAT